MGGSLFFLGSIGHASGASDDATAARCIDAASKGQRARDDGHLVDARARLVSCSADECPTIVKRDCVEWLAAVNERLPSVVVSTRAADGGDLVGAKVTVDGHALAPEQLGRSLDLDPGPHRIEVSLAGYRPKTESIVLLEREKARTVVILLAREGGDPATIGARAPKRSIPTLSWVLGGVALAGTAGFAFFWARGMDEVTKLRASCAPSCSDDQIDHARGPITIAHVSLGIAITAAVGAAAAYLLIPERLGRRYP